MTLFYITLIIIQSLVHHTTTSINASLPTTNISFKIVGGQLVHNQSEYPFMASIRIHNHHVCGGSIITHKHVLTAAHCCFDGDGEKFSTKILSIAVGSLSIQSNEKTIIKFVEEIIHHNKYNPKFVQDYDIAILKINGHFDDRRLQPIPLSLTVPEKSMCTVAGWGVIKFGTAIASSDLLFVQVPILRPNICKRYYGDLITLNVICAGELGKDSCQGDSGGPLICNNTLTGIVSWGTDCAKVPGVYTAVSKYLPWIYSKINRAVVSLPMTINILLCSLCIHLF